MSLFKKYSHPFIFLTKYVLWIESTISRLGMSFVRAVLSPKIPTELGFSKLVRTEFLSNGLVDRNPQNRKEVFSLYRRWIQGNIDFMNGDYRSALRLKKSVLNQFRLIQGQNQISDSYPPILSHSFSVSVGHLGLQLLHKECRGYEIPVGDRAILRPKEVGNEEVFQFISHQQQVIPIEKFNITNSLQLSPLVENLEIIKAKDYYLDIYELMESFCLRLRESSVERRTRISAEILASMNEYWHSSREKLSQLDLAPGVPFVVLHVREIRNRKDIRNASILNYFDAIQYVLDAGFKVVRIGSAESSLPHRAPPGLIDLGGLPEANCLLLYLLIECKAFIGTSSGPNVLAQMLGTPSLLTNMTSLARNTFSFPYTLYLPKVVSTNGKIAGIENYYSSRNAFGEMTDSSLARIGMNIRENTKKEILDATRDLLIGLEGDLTHSKDTDRNSMRHRLLDLGSLTTGNLAPSFLESHLN